MASKQTDTRHRRGIGTNGHPQSSQRLCDSFSPVGKGAVTITVLVTAIPVPMLLGRDRQGRANSLPLPGAQLLTPKELKCR